MNKKLERYRQLRDKKKARLEKAQKDMDRLEQMVQDEENTQIVAAVRSYSLTPEELEAFLMAFKLKNHLFPDESARCFVPEEEEEISEMLLPLRSSVSIAVQPASAEMSVILLPDRTSVLSFV